MEPYVNYIGLHWKTPFWGWVKTKKSYLRIENELEAHILRIRSTDEYYNLTEYHSPTPPYLGVTDQTIFYRKSDL